MRTAVTAAFLLLSALPAAGADWKFSTSANFETGKYGGTARVDTFYVPFTLKRYYGGGDLSVTLPFLRQSSAGEVTRVGGRPQRVAGGAARSAKAESGPGDVLLKGTYAVNRDGPGSFDFALGGRLKLPTANEDKGLGTGELDQGAGFEFGKELNPRWTLLADAYYTIIGDPEGVNYNNQLSLSLGVYRPLPAGLGLTVLYETSSALIDDSPDPRSLSCSLSGAEKDGVRLTAGLSLGLSEGGPDLGLSAGFSRKF